MALVKVKFMRDHKGQPLVEKVILAAGGAGKLPQVFRPSDEPFAVERKLVEGRLNRTLQVVEEVVDPDAALQ